MPIPLVYSLVLNTTNTSMGVENLPDFNAEIKLYNNVNAVVSGLR